jgi:hypothetical protein
MNGEKIIRVCRGEREQSRHEVNNYGKEGRKE